LLHEIGRLRSGSASLSALDETAFREIGELVSLRPGDSRERFACREVRPFVGSSTNESFAPQMTARQPSVVIAVMLSSVRRDACHPRNQPEGEQERE
jgi:hypothetical protein